MHSTHCVETRNIIRQTNPRRPEKVKTESAGSRRAVGHLRTRDSKMGAGTAYSERPPHGSAIEADSVAFNVCLSRSEFADFFDFCEARRVSIEEVAAVLLVDDLRSFSDDPYLQEVLVSEIVKRYGPMNRGGDED